MILSRLSSRVRRSCWLSVAGATARPAAPSIATTSASRSSSTTAAYEEEEAPAPVHHRPPLRNDEWAPALGVMAAPAPVWKRPSAAAVTEVLLVDGEEVVSSAGGGSRGLLASAGGAGQQQASSAEMVPPILIENGDTTKADELVVEGQQHQRKRQWKQPQPQQQQQQQQQQQVLAGVGDLRLAEFIEQVKTELWQFDAVPLRRRFRIQSLLRRLQTPPFETWSDSLVRASDSCARPFTRTLLAKHEASPFLSPIEAPGFDLLLLCWRPGAASVIHDHPKAGCWVKVLKGEMKETRYAVAPGDTDTSNDDDKHLGGNHLLEISTIQYTPGTVSYIEDSMGYHKVENPSVLEECISLHLYAPGIAECTSWPDASSLSNGVRTSLSLDGDFVSQNATQRFSHGS